MTVNNVIVVGAGPAGIGIASLLRQSGMDYLVLDKKEIGASFQEWPKNMEMITPSFPSNAFGQIDLNSICEATSPAFSFNKEHLVGQEYAEYLTGVAEHFQLNVQSHTEVKRVFEHLRGWVLETNQGRYFCEYLIWAAGEFQNPQMKIVSGTAHCIHSSLIKDPSSLQGNAFVVIGGYESGVQMAFDLIQSNKKVTLINPQEIDDMTTSDPSRVLSPFTYVNKYSKIKDSPQYTEILGEVNEVLRKEKGYQLRLKDETLVDTEEKPICATGFDLVKGPIEEFIIYREDGSPRLREETDEFFGLENMYLSGPSVRHDNHIFCFIYKFRQRFGVIVEDILKKEGYDEEFIAGLVKNWSVNGMYLSDLSCCGDECVC